MQGSRVESWSVDRWKVTRRASTYTNMKLKMSLNQPTLDEFAFELCRWPIVRDATTVVSHCNPIIPQGARQVSGASETEEDTVSGGLLKLHA